MTSIVIAFFVATIVFGFADVIFDGIATEKFRTITPGCHIGVKGPDGDYHIERVVAVNDWNSYIITETGHKYNHYDWLFKRIVIG